MTRPKGNFVRPSLLGLWMNILGVNSTSNEHFRGNESPVLMLYHDIDLDLMISSGKKASFENVLVKECVY